MKPGWQQRLAPELLVPEEGQEAADTNFRHWAESTVAQKCLHGCLQLLGMFLACPSS